MLIGELSKKTGASARSLRYYEQKGIISGRRLENGYRHFDEDQYERVRMTQFYLGLGLSVEMIGRILSCQGTEILPEAGGPCESGLLGLYQEKQREVEEQIRSLEWASKRLQERIEVLKAQVEETCPNSPRVDHIPYEVTI